MPQNGPGGHGIQTQFLALGQSLGIKGQKIGTLLARQVYTLNPLSCLTLYVRAEARGIRISCTGLAKGCGK